MYLTRKLKIDLKITQKLFPLVAFVPYRMLPSTATQIMALGETQTIGLTSGLIHPDVAVVSLA